MSISIRYSKMQKITKFLFVGTQFELKGGKALLRAFSNAYKKNSNISLNIITHLPDNYSQNYLISNKSNLKHI